MKQHKQLWRDAFHDTEEYTDYYFQNKAKRSEVFSSYDGTVLRGMAFFTPYTVIFRGAKRTAYYIVGVATHEKYRRQGCMSRLLQKGMEACAAKEGEDTLFFLCPETPRVYETLGFVTVYRHDEIIVERTGHAWFRTKRMKTLADGEKQQVISFVKARIRQEKCELYMDHTVSYYEEVIHELRTLQGDVLVLYEKDEVIAVVNYTYEEERFQITEWIGLREKGEKIAETLLAYWNSGCLYIEDTYFLTELSGQGITKRHLSKPYIMCRFASGRTVPPLRCYINDIT